MWFDASLQLRVAKRVFAATLNVSMLDIRPALGRNRQDAVHRLLLFLEASVLDTQGDAFTHNGCLGGLISGIMQESTRSAGLTRCQRGMVGE